MFYICLLREDSSHHIVKLKKIKDGQCFVHGNTRACLTKVSRCSRATAAAPVHTGSGEVLSVGPPSFW